MRKGIVIDENGGLVIDGGSMVIGETDAQNVQLILSANKGDFRFEPLVGCNLIRFVKSRGSSISEMRRETKVQLQGDGYRLSSFELDANGEFQVEYENNY